MIRIIRIQSFDISYNMAINKNHEFEELNGVKCAIVEKNAPKERVEFLKELLEFNRYHCNSGSFSSAKSCAATQTG